MYRRKEAGPGEVQVSGGGGDVWTDGADTPVMGLEVMVNEGVAVPLLFVPEARISE